MIKKTTLPPASLLSLRWLPWLGLVAASAPLFAQNPAPATVPPPITQVATPYLLEDLFPGLQFDQPLAIVSAPGDKQRLFVVEKTGRIQVVTKLDSSTPVKQVFLDLTGPADGKLETRSECGILGLAFPPDYATSGRCFVYYSLRIGRKLHQRLSRFPIMAEDGNRADVTNEQPLWMQADEADNHNGGDLHFGPDGYLYISVGDGGQADDKLNQARFINKGFHAAILRIDVDKRAGSLRPNRHPGIALDTNHEAFYAVPGDNPFIGAATYHGESIDPQTVRTEIWATGLRNPWRFSFDLPTGRLFAADVGQNLYEEVNLITKGGDYGWSYREAMHPFPQGPGKEKEPVDFHPIPPIFEYPHSTGISITGGVVYHGKRFPELNGVYFAADFGTGVVMGLREKEKSWTAETVAREPGISGIGIDPRNGDVLFANIGLGLIKRLVKAPGNPVAP